MKTIEKNCDKFKTAKEAREAFQNIRGHGIYAECSLWNPPSEIDKFIEWLFSPVDSKIGKLNDE